MRVAVDGPSGSGKSSVSKALATKYGWGYVDTGAMYRACAWFMLNNHVAVDDARAVADRIGDVQLALGTDPANPTIAVGGVDVSAAIREVAITEAVSKVSAVPEVRERMVAAQRELADELQSELGGVIMEGRDIGSAVLTEAPVKIFLTADVEARAARRALEDAEAGRAGGGDVTSTGERLAARDAADSSREASPLRQVDGAVEIDATFMTLDEVVAAADSLVQTQLDAGLE